MIGRQLACIAASVTALVTAGATGHTVASAAGPGGWNDWSCHLSANHPEPVVLVHGTSDNAGVWATLGPELADAGYCAYALTYGTAPAPLQVYGGIGPMRDSAHELGAFVDRVLQASGSAHVDLVGHSQGALMPEYYVKFLGGAARVHRYVALAGLWDGTTRPLRPGAAIGTPLEQPAAALTEAVCAACRELEHGSEFLTELRAGGVLAPGPAYTNIVTTDDTVVVPYTSGLAAAPNATNIVVQDVCPGHLVDHGSLPADPVVAGLVRQALDPDAEAVSCTR